MAKKHKCPECVQKVAEYMLTYGDMVTLLLCFFILLYTVGETKKIEVRVVLSAFNNTTGMLTGGSTLQKSTLEEMGMNLETLPSQTVGRSFSKAENEATALFKQEIQQGKVIVSEDERGLIISLVDADYFDPGSAKLKPPIKATLLKAAGLIQNLERFVKVEGHSDTSLIRHNFFTPNRSERVYLNNWDLAGARAINSTVYMINSETLDPSWFQVASFGSYRPLVVEQPGTPEAKAFNRRIDIVILTEKSTKRSRNDSNYELTPTKLPKLEQIQ